MQLVLCYIGKISALLYILIVTKIIIAGSEEDYGFKSSGNCK